MTQCLKCRKVKFWFQMFSQFQGMHTATYELCRACANSLRQRAVEDFLWVGDYPHNPWCPRADWKVSGYLVYAIHHLRAAIAKFEDAPASSAQHERDAKLALQLQRTPTITESLDWASDLSGAQTDGHREESHGAS